MRVTKEMCVQLIFVSFFFLPVVSHLNVYFLEILRHLFSFFFFFLFYLCFEGRQKSPPKNGSSGLLFYVYFLRLKILLRRVYMSRGRCCALFFSRTFALFLIFFASFAFYCFLIRVEQERKVAEQKRLASPAVFCVCVCVLHLSFHAVVAGGGQFFFSNLLRP